MWTICAILAAIMVEIFAFSMVFILEHKASKEDIEEIKKNYKEN